MDLVHSILSMVDERIIVFCSSRFIGDLIGNDGGRVFNESFVS